jgi:hypothetical protein
MQHWLPILVGIEKSVILRIGADDAEEVRGEVEEDHASHLTRQEVTAAVHFVHFSLTTTQVERFRNEPVSIVTDHPNYHERTLLAADSQSALAVDLLG